MNGQRYFYLEREAKRRERRRKEGNKEGKKKESDIINFQNVTSIRPVNLKITPRIS